MSIPLLDAAEQLADELIAWRRHLHAHPELSGHEEQTARFIADELSRMGYAPQERVGGTFGLIADLDAGSGSRVGLRADMDALPLTEETGLAFASQRKGVMHACGHDAHVAMLLGAARLLKDRQQELNRPVRFVFQAAEELWPGGATALIDAGILADMGCLLGLHIWSEMPIGTVGTRAGPFMSHVDDVKITIRGKGGHGAMPQQCIDPIVIAAELILALQTIVSRSISMTDHAVVSIAQVQGGTAFNIIPETVNLRGSIRTLTDTTRTTVHAKVQELAAGIAAAHGAQAEVKIAAGYPALLNHKAVVDRALAAARELGVRDDRILTLPPQSGSEDFAYYAQRIPAALVFLGARNEATGCSHPHHHPRFNIDETAIPLGAALLAAFALGST